MLVYGIISPHPPIILPEIGGDNLKHVRKTIHALERAVGDLAAAKPDALIIIAPHEGHGFDVPKHFLRAKISADLPVEEILVTRDSYQYYYDLGRRVGARIGPDPKRYAIVASGDLSHVLKADGPYGYNPAGPVLDEQLVAAVRRGDAQAQLEIDPKILADGAECGLRSILFLQGALDGAQVTSEVLSYEGPFGVGYMVASFAVGAAKPVTLPDLARFAIHSYFQSETIPPAPGQLPADFTPPAGAFVSLHSISGDLRGCIGTISPTKPNVAEEVINNAVMAAVADTRFDPVDPAELDDLEISVDVLTKPIPAGETAKLDPKEYGLIVTAADGRSGVLLPDLDGIDTAAEQIRICREKGGIGPQEPVTISKFKVIRYIR